MEKIISINNIYKLLTESMAISIAYYILNIKLFNVYNFIIYMITISAILMILEKFSPKTLLATKNGFGIGFGFGFIKNQNSKSIESEELDLDKMGIIKVTDIEKIEKSLKPEIKPALRTEIKPELKPELKTEIKADDVDFGFEKKTKSFIPHGKLKKREEEMEKYMKNI